MAIQYDKIEGKEIFSDDRAILPDGILAPILEWLESGRDYARYFRLPVRFSMTPFSLDLSEIAGRITEHEMCFQRHIWQVGTRWYWTAMSADKKYEILGCQIAATWKGCTVIGPSPVKEQVAETPGDLWARKWADLSAIIWADMTEEERAKHPRIGEAARYADFGKIGFE